MDRFETLRTFVAVARRRSFVEAARDLSISPTAASRLLSELERGLGVTLLRRTTRSVTLTPEGSAYLDRCRAILEDLDDADRSLRGEDAEPRGSLTLTAPVVFGRMHVLPVAVGLMRAHPALDVRLLLTDRLIRLAEEGVDVALRIGDLADSASHGVRLGWTRRVLVAAPAYLQARGVPAAVADLGGHDVIVFDNFAPSLEWRFGPDGASVFRCEPRFFTNGMEAAIEAAVQGLGVARVLSYQVRDRVAAGELAYVLAPFDPAPVPVSLIFQANRRRHPNVAAYLAAFQAYARATPFD
jgi:DNA-binding transcriptional LysR family regulator